MLTLFASRRALSLGRLLLLGACTDSARVPSAPYFSAARDGAAAATGTPDPCAPPPAMMSAPEAEGERRLGEFCNDPPPGQPFPGATGGTPNGPVTVIREMTVIGVAEMPGATLATGGAFGSWGAFSGGGFSGWIPVLHAADLVTAPRVAYSQNEDANAAAEEMSDAELEACPDCVLDAVSLLLSVAELYGCGVSKERLMALVSDVGALLIPGFTSPAWARPNRISAIRMLARQGIAEHAQWKALRRAEGYLTEVTVPAPLSPHGLLGPKSYRLDAVRVDPGSRTVFIAALKPAGTSGVAAMDEVLPRYQSALTKYGFVRKGDVSYDVRGWNVKTERHFYSHDSTSLWQHVCGGGPVL